MDLSTTSDPGLPLGNKFQPIGDFHTQEHISNNTLMPYKMELEEKAINETREKSFMDKSFGPEDLDEFSSDIC